MNEDQSKSLDVLIEKVKSSLLEKPGKQLVSDFEQTNLPKAAVALILRPDRNDGELEILFIKRNNREGDPWSGHMAFPGGRYSEVDQDLLATVIREVIEETGIDLRDCSILGALDEILPGNFSIRVTPYVALAHDTLKVRISPEEVEDFAWVPLSFFRDRNRIEPYKITRLGHEIEVPSYRVVENQIIWGMTFRMIEDFLAKIA